MRVNVVVAIRQPSGLNEAAHSLTKKESKGAWVSTAGVDDAVGAGDGETEGEEVGVVVAVVVAEEVAAGVGDGETDILGDGVGEAETADGC